LLKKGSREGGRRSEVVVRAPTQKVAFKKEDSSITSKRQSVKRKDFAPLYAEERGGGRGNSHRRTSPQENFLSQLQATTTKKDECFGGGKKRGEGVGEET